MGGVEDFPPNRVSYGGGYTAGNLSQWPMEEFLGLSEFSQYYNYMDGSSKVHFKLQCSLFVLCSFVGDSISTKNETNL